MRTRPRAWRIWDRSVEGLRDSVMTAELIDGQRVAGRQAVEPVPTVRGVARHTVVASASAPSRPRSRPPSARDVPPVARPSRSTRLCLREDHRDGSEASRWAANSSDSSDAASSHCASSTATSSGECSAAAARRHNVAAPMRNGRARRLGSAPERAAQRFGTCRRQVRGIRSPGAPVRAIRRTRSRSRWRCRWPVACIPAPLSANASRVLFPVPASPRITRRPPCSRGGWRRATPRRECTRVTPKHIYTTVLARGRRRRPESRQVSGVAVGSPWKRFPPPRPTVDGPARKGCHAPHDRIQRGGVSRPRQPRLDLYSAAPPREPRSRGPS